jgi:hypothetical protein
MEHLNSIIKKNLNINKKNSRKNKNIIVVNYKPVFVHSRQQKPIPTNNNSHATPPNNRRCSMATSSSDNSKTSHSSNQQSVLFDVPDVEDPLIFIEMMYQQLFTEDGQVRSDIESKALANCVKQIVTQSRRNSAAHRDSISSNIHQHKLPRTSLSSSPCFIRNTVSEEEEPHTLLQRNRTANTSRR